MVYDWHMTCLEADGTESPPEHPCISANFGGLPFEDAVEFMFYLWPGSRVRLEKEFVIRPDVRVRIATLDGDSGVAAIIEVRRTVSIARHSAQ